MVWPFTSSSSKAKQLDVPLVQEVNHGKTSRASFSSFRSRKSRIEDEPVSIELQESPRSITSPSLQSSHLDSGYESLMQPEAEAEPSPESEDMAKSGVKASRWRLPGVSMPGRKRGDSNVSLQERFGTRKKSQSVSPQSPTTEGGRPLA
jgi:hypothetical protein